MGVSNDAFSFIKSTMANDTTLTDLLASSNHIYTNVEPNDSVGYPELILSYESSTIFNKVIRKPQVLIKVYAEKETERSNIIDRLYELFHYKSVDYSTTITGTIKSKEENILRASVLINITHNIN